MQQFRRQLTLFLPERERQQVDAVRQWLDPHQYQIIAAHVTLCRESEIADWKAIYAVLPSVKIDIAMAFGKPIRLEDGCVMLPVNGSTENYDALRQAILGRYCNKQKPQITQQKPKQPQGRN